MNYKLVCIDMDGTLLNEKGEVTQENKLALKKVHEKDVTIAFTTGRNYQGARAFHHIVGIDGPIISSNGACIVVPGHGAPIYEQVLTYDEVAMFYNCAKKYNLEVQFATTKGVLCNFTLPKDHAYVKLNESLKEGSKIEITQVENYEDAFKDYEGHIFKAICMDKKGTGELGKLREELTRLGHYEIVASWFDNIEVMPKGVSKGNGVRMLAKHLDIPREAIICIGDNENDLSMIEYAGMGIAMGNGVEAVLKIADDVTLTNNESGVAKAIEKYILNQA